MAPSSMEEPFVVPVGRDFAPRMKYGFTAVDEVPLSDLLQNGIEREISFYTTHTMADFLTIAQNDQFYLGNHQFNVKIPCQFPIPFLQAHCPSHQTVEVDFHKIPEKLWHQFRPDPFMGDSPEAPAWWWRYGTTELRMLRLDWMVKVEAHAFRNLETAFQRSRCNTIPLHLCHAWSYYGTEVKTVYTGSDGWVSLVEEKGKPTDVINVWKDFLVVRREAKPKKVILGIASDLHYADRNAAIREAYPHCEDINARIAAFAEKAYSLWREGKLDYLILNGDCVDFSTKTTTEAPWSSPPKYEGTNWSGFEKAAGLVVPPWDNWPRHGPSRRPDGHQQPKSLLFHVPLIWNLGDHDRLMYRYPLPTPGEGQVSHVESHYNTQGLAEGEGGQFDFSPTTRSGESASHLAALRWVYEHGRMEGWPLTMVFRVGQKTYQLHCLDTGYMRGGFYGETFPPGLPDAEAYPMEPLHCSGLKAGTLPAVNSAADFNILITHAPAICLPPTDSRHEEGGVFGAGEATYGAFEPSRQQLLALLAELVRANKPALVVSGHVHFGSMYALTDSPRIETGPRLRKLVALLAERPTLDMHIEPEVFWRRTPCLLLTTPPIGPRPTRAGQHPAFLLLDLGPNGVSRIAWEEV